MSFGSFFLVPFGVVLPDLLGPGVLPGLLGFRGVRRPLGVNFPVPPGVFLLPPGVLLPGVRARAVPPRVVALDWAAAALSSPALLAWNTWLEKESKRSDPERT